MASEKPYNRKALHTILYIYNSIIPMLKLFHLIRFTIIQNVIYRIKHIITAKRQVKKENMISLNNKQFFIMLFIEISGNENLLLWV